MTSTRLIALAVGCSVAATAPVTASAGDDGPGFLVRTLDRIDAAIAATAEERYPVLVPPVPVEVTYKARKGASIDLGGPLLALSAADVDADGTAELIALTETELVVMRYKQRGEPTVVARAALPGDRAATRPRDPVGTVVVTDAAAAGAKQIWARSSLMARGARFELVEGVLSDVGAFDDFALCESTFAALSDGRNYFEASSVRWPEGAAQPPVARQFYAAHCPAGIVDPSGCPTDVLAVSAVDGTLAVRADTTCPGGAHLEASHAAVDRELDAVGVAVAVADVDNDGDIEAIVSAETAPGDPDRVTVYTWTGERKKQLFSREFMGGVAAIATGDIDGDGDIDVVSAVRLLGSDRIDLWTLN